MLGWLLSSADNLCKQFRPRSGPTFCQSWSVVISVHTVWHSDSVHERNSWKSYIWKWLADNNKSKNYPVYKELEYIVLSWIPCTAILTVGKCLKWYFLILWLICVHFSISCMPRVDGVSCFNSCFDCLHLCKSQSMIVLETEKELNDLCMSLEWVISGVLILWTMSNRAYPGSEFVVANTLAKLKKLEPNENSSQGFSQEVVSTSWFIFKGWCLLSADNLCKQFGPRSDPTKCQAWSGSKLFNTQVVLKKIQNPKSKIWHINKVWRNSLANDLYL